MSPSPTRGELFSHTTFGTSDIVQAAKFYDAVLTAGGTDEGLPGLRAHYHPNYYGAYVRDFDGKTLCAVCHHREG